MARKTPGRKPAKPAHALARSKADRPKKASRLDRKTAKIHEYMAEVGRYFYKIGKALAEVRDGRLFLEKHGTFDEYLSSEVSIARSTAYKFIRIATTFQEDVAERVGVERLEASLGYLDATPEDDSPDDLPGMKIRVKTADGTLVKPILDASLRDIEQATKEVLARNRARVALAHGGAGQDDVTAFLENVRAVLGKANDEITRVSATWSSTEETHLVRIDRVRFGNLWRTLSMIANVAAGDTKKRARTKR